MHIRPYSLPLLRAALRGTVGDDELTVSAVIPDVHRHPDVPCRVSGPVIGLGSLISVRDRDTGQLVEDIRSSWILCRHRHKIHYSDVRVIPNRAAFSLAGEVSAT